MEWLSLVIGLLIGAGTGGAAIWAILRHHTSTPAPLANRWSVVLVPMLISEGCRMELPKAALAAAFSLAHNGKVVFDLFIEMPRSHDLNSPIPTTETEISMELLEAAESEARSLSRIVETGIEKVRDYGYGVVEAVRQVGATAVVLEAAIVQHSPAQRGELGRSARQPNTSTLMMLIHDRTGCDVLIVGAQPYYTSAGTPQT